MFRIYKKNKNFVMRISFFLTILVILSFLNFNNQPYANVNERSDLSDLSNTEIEEIEYVNEDKEPKASTDISSGGTYQGITYTDIVWIKTSDLVIFINCVFEGSLNLYVQACNVTIDLCSLTKIDVYNNGTQLSVTNSTLNIIIDSDSVDATGYYEFINCTFREYSSYYNFAINHASVYLKNCTTYDMYVKFYENNVTMENCVIYGELIFDTDKVTAVVRDCKINNIRLSNGDITIQDSEFQKGDIGINSSLNETLELKSNTPNVVLSNFKLVDPFPEIYSRLVIQAGSIFNISDIPKEIFSSLYIMQLADSDLYVKNSYLATLVTNDGAKVSNIQNCTFIDAMIRSNNTVFTDCNIYNTLDVDTKNKPFKIENSKFFDVIIHVISGGVDIDNCDFKTDMGLLWLDTKDSFALINNSNPRFIWVNLNTSLIAENLVCNSISMRDTSHGTFSNVDVENMNVIDSATPTIDNCHINNANFDSPNVQITNSIVDSMAPTLDAIPSPLKLDNLKDFILNWSAQPGTNFTGNILSYKVFRANMGIGSGAPSSTDFEEIYSIDYPDPTDPFDTKYNDTELEFPSDLDGYELYYMVEITDAGGNSGNSTILSTAYDTGLVFDVLDATVIFDDSLTTYDDILVSVFMIDADINDNGTQDVGKASLHCQFKYGSTILDQTIEPTGESIEGIVYYFLIPQTLAATEITFSIQLEQNSYYDAQGIGLFDFNSTTKYGKKFTIERPTIAFNPVDHPSDDKILVSKRIKLSVSAVSYAQYISSIKVYYREDGGDWESKSMSYDFEDSEYTVKLPKFDPCTLEYYVKYIDIAGNEDEILGSKDDPETIEIIPDFPQTKLEAFDLSMIFIGSALVGIVFGFAYVLLDLNLKKRSLLKRTQKLKTFLNYSDKSKKAPAKKTPAKKTSAKKTVEGK